jgi:alkane 1-monooxygenase
VIHVRSKLLSNFIACPFEIFVLAPLIDMSLLYLFPMKQHSILSTTTDIDGRTKKKKKETSDESLYTVVLQLYAGLYAVIWLLSMWATRSMSLTSSLYWWHIVSLGFVSGTGISIAHELFHRYNDYWATFLGKLILTGSNYTHFAIEHVYGHHKTVCTPSDPATSRRNETFYQFYVRSAIGGYLSAWKYELDRIGEKYNYKDGIKEHLKENRLLSYTAMYIVIPITIAVLCGFRGVLCYYLQALIGTMVIETSNYYEHYGLTRKRNLYDGTYEPVQPKHSWDSSHAYSCMLYVNLMLHSHHHAKPVDHYQNLKLTDQSAKLPFPYSVMFFLSLIPPVFLPMMNAKLDEHLNNTNNVQVSTA